MFVCVRVCAGSALLLSKVFSVLLQMLDEEIASKAKDDVVVLVLLSAMLQNTIHARWQDVLRNPRFESS